MTSAAELAAQIRQTRGFIDADATEAVLTPRSRSKTASGGWSWVVGTPRPSQRFKLSLLNYDRRPTITDAGGVVRNIDYHLIGMPDMEIEVGDTWSDGTTTYEVVGFSSGRNYETKAFIATTTPEDEVPTGG